MAWLLVIPIGQGLDPLPRPQENFFNLNRFSCYLVWFQQLVKVLEIFLTNIFELQNYFSFISSQKYNYNQKSYATLRTVITN